MTKRSNRKRSLACLLAHSLHKSWMLNPYYYPGSIFKALCSPYELITISLTRISFLSFALSRTLGLSHSGVLGERIGRKAVHVLYARRGLLLGKFFVLILSSTRFLYYFTLIFRLYGTGILSHSYTFCCRCMYGCICVFNTFITHTILCIVYSSSTTTVDTYSFTPFDYW